MNGTQTGGIEVAPAGEEAPSRSAATGNCSWTIRFVAYRMNVRREFNQVEKASFNPIIRCDNRGSGRETATTSSACAPPSTSGKACTRCGTRLSIPSRIPPPRRPSTPRIRATRPHRTASTGRSPILAWSSITAAQPTTSSRSKAPTAISRVWWRSTRKNRTHASATRVYTARALRSGSGYPSTPPTASTGRSTSTIPPT